MAYTDVHIEEEQRTDLKSLRTVTGKSADWDTLAKDCVCFANGAGGRLRKRMLVQTEGMTARELASLLESDGGDNLSMWLGRLVSNGLVHATGKTSGTRYPESSSADINRRIGVEISAKTVKRALDESVGAGEIAYSGDRRWRRYRLTGMGSKGQKGGQF